MIPVNLRMRNFMPYKGDAPPLCFTPIHTACISGDNGAGKSSIIDAITWALWGRSRAKSDDDLIHQGENETRVEFDFSSGGQLFRVVRQHARPKGKRASGQSSLDLFSITDSGCIPICGDNKTQTQEKLNNTILHMDYETFTSSAYLRQGHADEFTRQDPADRKEVLANILGLSIYDKYEDMAKEKAKYFGDEAGILRNNLLGWDKELADNANCDGELKETLSVINNLRSTIEKKDSELKSLRQKRGELDSLHLENERLERDAIRLIEDIERWETNLKQSQKQVEEFQAIIELEREIDTGYAEFVEKRELLGKQNQKEKERFRLEERYSRLTRVFDQEKSKLDTRHKVIETRITHFEETAQNLDSLKAQLIELQPKQIELKQSEEKIAGLRKNAQELNSSLTKLTSEATRLKQEIADIDEKLKLLSTTADRVHCPLCETELGNEGLNVVSGKYLAEKVKKLERISAIGVEASQVGSVIKRAEEDIVQLDAKFKQNNEKLIAQETRIAQSVKEANAANIKLAEEKQSLESVESTLVTKDFAHDEQRVMVQIEAALEELGYDEKLHHSLEQEVEILEKYDQLKRNLDDALNRIYAEENKVTTARAAIQELKNRQDLDIARQKEIAARVAQFPEIMNLLNLAENEYQTLLKQQQTSQQRLGGLEERTKYLKTLEQRVSEARTSLTEAVEKETIYRELVRIFGKKGIQAMLIETALPEIEAEANRLLSRMTDGRMSLTFEPQKVTRKGTIAETLDIKIADELGTRNYEMFSGGEAFRIDFAIRIALSRLLARRADAPLPTLIIDEGFGTQDADGIEKLKEAINSVQNEFEKILVITHIDELKDAFPTRIDVVKKVESSTIEVS